MTEKTYTADLLPKPDEFDRGIQFTVCYDPDGAQPWTVVSDIGCTKHSTLDEALFWELVMDGPHITEQLRESIAAEWTAAIPSLS